MLGHASGLHLVIQFGRRVFTKKAVREIAGNGARVYRIEPFYLPGEQAHNDRIVLGYSHLSPEEIAEGISIISRVIARAE